MTREQFLDIVASVGATAEIDRRRVIACGRPQPFVRVSLAGERGARSRAWSRPTFRQAFGEAVAWLQEIGA